MDFGTDYEFLDGNDFKVESENIQEIEIKALRYICLLKEPYKILNSIVGFKALECLTKCSINSTFFENSEQNDLKDILIETIIDF